MKIKRISAGLLALGMLTVTMSGCGNNENSNTDNTGTSTSVSSQSNTSSSNEDIEEIIMMYPIMGTITQTGAKGVEDAINAITEPQIGVHISLNPIEIGSYAQQLNLMITSNEQLDIVATFPGGSATFSAMSSQNQLLPLNDLLDQYGQNIQEKLGELINVTKINGNIYSLTTYFNKSASPMVAMRTDLLEKYNLVEQAENATSMKDLEPIFDVILENEPSISPISGGFGGSIFSPQFADIGAALDETVLYDSLGDNNSLIAVDYSSETPTVYNHYASDSYKNSCKLAREWYEKGYIYKDSATTTDNGDTLMKAGVIFAMPFKGSVDSADAKRATTGYDLTIVELNPIPISTGSCVSFTWGIPTTSKSPEAAMKFLNLMYDNADINNLLAWGVEGVDYQVLEDGTANYIEGQDASSCQYHTVDFLYGDNFSILPWVGTSADMRDRQLEAMNNAQISPYLGFTLDTTAIQNEITATTNVIEEYKAALEYGTIDPETELPNFIKRLNDSGAQKIIDEAQRQLDEWLAQNK